MSYALRRIDNISRHLGASFINEQVSTSELEANPVVGKVDMVDQLKPSIKPIRYREFKDDFPVALKTCLSKTFEQSFDQPSNQMNLLKPLAKTIMFDLYSKKLAGHFSQKQSFARAYCIGTKALYSKHAVNTMMQCNNMVGGNHFDLIYSDTTAEMIQFYTLAMQQPNNRQTPTMVNNNQNPRELFFNLKQLANLFNVRDIEKTNELRTRTKYGPMAAAIAHLESKMLNDVIQDDMVNYHPLRSLIILDSLVKIQDDIAWIVSKGIISPEFAAAVPFLVNEVCSSLVPHAAKIFKSLDC
ncbi:hypothetical protein SAMD00019534_097770 [Acytostelium subglobosum LB1]|uniref:hypothetical protein n=1 Tax=Acytostelium subglobosum LB1 TaxID=1410327 RepID=UPI000644A5D1|nr:hypothetical protein SAMD00019534_097770 [Acytostelium subglobosum LB1]GAM26602.1 hypothetical protein SAMD00019534_097770 [Acytostelium subglobosum LB1]|eukprot:XP_012750263.1 hypothetical protein SAMD00019534_097770 [Acytostelium subglobosum LB1]